MTDYNAGVYRAQGGNELVLASSTANSGTAGKITVQSGSQGIHYPVQSLGTSETATTVIGHGLTSLTASTTGPTYTIGSPAAAGLVKWIAISAATSAASNVVLAGDSTGVQIGVTGDNQVTITSTGAGAGVTLVSASTTTWALVGGGTQVTAAQST